MPSSDELKINCGCIILILIIYLLIGTWSVNYIAQLFAVSLPLTAAILIGIVAGEATIPVAIVVFILKLCGVL